MDTTVKREGRRDSRESITTERVEYSRILKGSKKTRMENMKTEKKEIEAKGRKQVNMTLLKKPIFMTFLWSSFMLIAFL